jgi:Uncharacterized protein conserved in bacteria
MAGDDARDWRPGVVEHLGFYVYLLIDPATGLPFYVGKGRGDRCFSHITEARHTTADTKGDYAKLATIRRIEASGSVRIELLRHGLDEDSALLVESTAIDLLGLPTLKNRVGGHDAAGHGRMADEDLNALYGARPVSFDLAHRVLLVRVARAYRSGMSAEALYDITRSWWVVGRDRRMLGSPRAPEIAMSVYMGVVRAVYRIESWEQPSAELIAEDPGTKDRWGFVGKRAPDLEQQYLLADVTAHLAPSAQWPLRYINC